MASGIMGFSFFVAWLVGLFDVADCETVFYISVYERSYCPAILDRDPS
jgi:hypothetical protein